MLHMLPKALPGTIPEYRAISKFWAPLTVAPKTEKNGDTGILGEEPGHSEGILDFNLSKFLQIRGGSYSLFLRPLELALACLLSHIQFMLYPYSYTWISRIQQLFLSLSGSNLFPSSGKHWAWSSKIGSNLTTVNTLHDQSKLVSIVLNYLVVSFAHVLPGTEWWGQVNSGLQSSLRVWDNGRKFHPVSEGPLPAS